MNIGLSLLRLRDMITSKHRWNTYFSMPDIGQYPNLEPLPKITWAGILHKLLKGTEIEEDVEE